MMNTAADDVWTDADERRFNEMDARRDRVFRKRREGLMRAIGMLAVEHEQRETLADRLIKHADEMRDALLPYDSGVRAAPEQQR